MTWEKMVESFLTIYFPPVKAAKLRNEISFYVQSNLESLYKTWEQFKCFFHQHRFPKWMIVHTFYNRLNLSTRELLNAAIGGTLGSKTLENAPQLIEKITMNSYQWNTQGKKKVVSLHEINVVTSLAAQVEAFNKKLDASTSRIMAVMMNYDGCGGGIAQQIALFLLIFQHLLSRWIMWGSDERSSNPYNRQPL